MNEIFLLLWLADFVGSIGVVGTILAIGLCAGLIICLLVFVFGDDNEIGPTKKFIHYAKWWLLPVAIAVIMPSPTTVKALVVIRAGEYAIASPLGEKSIKALDAVLDRVISESKKSGSK